jgi:hypothetical protein
VHSPVGLDPAAYGVERHDLPFEGFAKNDVGFTDATGTDHDQLGVGLKKAIYNFMHGLGLDEDIRSWFDLDLPCPKSRIKRNTIAQALTQDWVAI